MRDIIVATANSGKLREIGELLGSLPVRLYSLSDYWDPVPAIPETGETFLENAMQKAAWVAGRVDIAGKGLWVLADDSGLEVDAIGGMPGVKSARFAGEKRDPAANNSRLLELLSDVPLSGRTARFRCAAVLMTSKDEYFCAEGACEGLIISAQRGGGGFGYDPLFVPAGLDKTFAELDPAEKNALSHRGKAFMKIGEYIHEKDA